MNNNNKESSVFSRFCNLFIGIEDGQSNVEYAIILAVITLVATVSLIGIGGSVDSSFGGVAEGLADEAIVTFVDEDDEHEVIGKIDHSLNEYIEGEVPEPEKEGAHFKDWITEDEEVFDMDTKIEEEMLVVTASWDDNEVVSRTFEFSEQKDIEQLRSLDIDNLYEVVSLEVDKGDVSLVSHNGDNIELLLNNRPYDRREQTGGKVTLADSKEVSAQTTSDYSKDGYKGTLKRYHYGGSIIPEDTKYVSGQTSASYDQDGYEGSLTRYLSSGSAANSKYVTGHSSRNYNSGGYSGTLDRYVYSGSYRASDTKHVSGQHSSYYNSGGYRGTLSRYVYSGSYTPRKSKYVTHSIPGDGGGTGWIRRNYGGPVSQGGYWQWEWYSPADTHKIYRTNPLSINYREGDYSGSLDYYRTTIGFGPYPRNVGNPSAGSTVTTPATKYDDYRGTIYKPASDTRVYRYRGNVTRPASDTRTFRYRGNVSKPDTRVYRYRGNVTKPAEDRRTYRYKGVVKRPYSDTRTWDKFYNYTVTVHYREK